MGWKDLDGDDVLPGYTLKIWKIEEVILLYPLLLFYTTFIIFHGRLQDLETSGSSEMSKRSESLEDSEMVMNIRGVS